MPTVLYCWNISFCVYLVQKCPAAKETPMPTYDYECKSCGYNFEVFQSIMD
ncbi:FmdB family zinc ribbon protein, partial [Salinispira pacifica]